MSSQCCTESILFDTGEILEAGIPVNQFDEKHTTLVEHFLTH